MIKFKGDTLIEVALAIGIFSMVAVAVVSVVTMSTTSAQSALETTVTREGIDAQAEALRFIQSSYLAGGQANLAGNVKYKSLWEAITARAVTAGSAEQPIFEAALAFNPGTCASLYSEDNLDVNNVFAQHGFIINTKNLGLSFDGLSATDIPAQTERIVVAATRGEKLFKEAATYPRVIYDTNEAWSNENDATNIQNNQKNTPVIGVEGLYVVAVKDPCSTNIVNGQMSGLMACPSGSGGTAAYYDFYIRSCWYGPGADRPSTISTVIRLYDPAAVQY